MIARLVAWWCQPRTVVMLGASLLLNCTLWFGPAAAFLPAPDTLVRAEFHNPFAGRNQPGRYVVHTH